MLSSLVYLMSVYKAFSTKRSIILSFLVSSPFARNAWHYDPTLENQEKERPAFFDFMKAPVKTGSSSFKTFIRHLQHVRCLLIFIFIIVEASNLPLIWLSPLCGEMYFVLLLSPNFVDGLLFLIESVVSFVVFLVYTVGESLFTIFASLA